MCDRRTPVAGQRKGVFAAAQLAGVYRLVFPGLIQANLSEPTIRNGVPVYQVATALGCAADFPRRLHFTRSQPLQTCNRSLAWAASQGNQPSMNGAGRRQSGFPNPHRGRCLTLGLLKIVGSESGLIRTKTTNRRSVSEDLLSTLSMGDNRLRNDACGRPRFLSGSVPRANRVTFSVDVYHRVRFRFVPVKAPDDRVLIESRIRSKGSSE